MMDDGVEGGRMERESERRGKSQKMDETERLENEEA